MLNAQMSERRLSEATTAGEWPIKFSQPTSDVH